MEEQYYLDRARLRELRKAHPDWSRSQLAQAVGRSLSWAKKWVKRLGAAAPDDEQVLWSRSRARHTPYRRVSPAVVARILDIRDRPPKKLARPPGPRAILYYLQDDKEMQASGAYLPRSTATIWQVLEEHGRIVRPHRPDHEPVERPAPMTVWEIDFKDVTTVPPDPEGKQQHMVEVLNVVDSGTSILVDARPRDDFTAATAIQAMAGVFLVHGLPRQITCDRDPRFVGGWQGRDFPSAFGRFLASLDIVVDVCPPRRPDLNPFVERYHRSYEHECLQVHRPQDLAQTVEVTEDYYWHYNTERPNQALTCGNRPPHVAHPVLPLLPRLPDRVDPDHWLQAIDRQRFKRRVQRNGMVQVDRHRYYVGKRWRGRLVNLQVDAAQRQLVVYVEGRVHKQLPIQGLHGERLDFADYLDLIGREAVSEWQRWLRQQGRRRW